MNKQSKRAFALVGLVAVLAVAPGAAFATKLFGTITGVVTAPPTYDRIIVDGRTYRILPGSAAASERNNVRVGQTVDLVLAPQDAKSSSGPAVTGVIIRQAGAP